MKAKALFTLLAATALTAGAETYYFDFGGSGTPGSRGTETVSPDANGHWWNNIMPVDNAATAIAAKTTFENLVDADGNVNKWLKLTLNNAWGVNSAGGLTSPKADLLADLAVASATTDYAFNTNNGDGGRSFTLRGLYPNKGYRITLFGSRSANDARSGIYTVTGSNAWNGEMQVAGSGIGHDGENQNTSETLVSDIVFPDALNNILVYIWNNKATYVPLSLMKVEVVDAETPAASGKVVRTMMFDFGSNGSNADRGTVTEGNWNNIVNNDGNYCKTGTVFDGLIDTEGNATGAALTTNARFSTNGGSGGGGLAYPEESQLGDFAVGTATNDYFYTESSETLSPMTFSGLSPLHAYRFHIFGTRNNAEARCGLFDLEGLNSWMGAHQVAGTRFDSSASQNTSNILRSEPVFPDKNGNIVLNVVNNAKTYVALSVMKIEELTDVTRPDIKSWQSVALNGGETSNMALRQESRAVWTVVSRLSADADVSLLAVDENGEDLSLPTDGVDKDGIYRVTVDLDTYNVVFFPITYVCVEGSAVGAWSTTGQEMSYQGNGVWNFRGELKGYDRPSDSGRVNFVLNKDWGQTYKRVKGTLNTIANGGNTEDIPLNPGNYDISLDLNTMTFDIANGLDDLDPLRITVMGSSVSNGQGATDNHGYAAMYADLLAERAEAGESANAFYVSNIAVNGNSSVNLLNRYDDLQREFGKYVIFGISLGNEGIHGAADQRAVYNQFYTNMMTLIAKAREDGKIPVVMNNYTRADFTADDYKQIKDMNSKIGYVWDVPSVNLLGAIDDGHGRWADGYGISDDIYHPNTDGHREFFYAMVPSMFDALVSGKELTMFRDNKGLWKEGAAYVMPSSGCISLTPEGTVHSFTLGLTVMPDGPGRVATVYDGNSELALYATADGFELRHDGDVLCQSAIPEYYNDKLHRVAVSCNYAARSLMLEIDNGGNRSFASFAFAPVAIHIGEPEAEDAAALTLGEIMFNRSSMIANDLAVYDDDCLFKSSLEIYTVLDGDTAEGKLENRAMSLNAMTLTLDGTTPDIPDTPDDEDALDSVGADSLTVRGIEGGVFLSSPTDADVEICSLSGRILRSFRLDAGAARTVRGLYPGVCLVNGRKVIVR